MKFRSSINNFRKWIENHDTKKKRKYHYYKDINRFKDYIKNQIKDKYLKNNNTSNPKLNNKNQSS